MLDPDFDNDDNPYGKFVLHQYTNMKNLSDTATNLTSSTIKKNFANVYKHEDREIQLVECKDKIDTSWRASDIK